MTLVDAGPLVALLSSGDGSHQICVEAVRAVRAPMLTVWPVLTEVMHLLRMSWSAQDAVWDMVSEGRLGLLPLDVSDVPRMRELMRKYNDLPMDVADAALVAVAEREGINRIFTLDRRDFEVYRPAKIGRFSLVP